MAKSPKTKKKKAGTKSGTDAPYLVLARKYRPQTFDDLIGQDAMVKTLANAFSTGRIAQAYMLTGVRGVGKTTTARILARALNFEKADGSGAPTIDLSEYGEHCEAIMASRHPDVIEMDAASNTGIDNVREIIENARYKPVSARTKVFIIDEVHMLSRGAFNALLKTLEEPPEHVKFIFATTEIRKVPVTVLSRCQRFDLRRVDAPTLMDHFAGIAKTEGSKAEPDALALITRASEGSVRDGLSILDQALAVADGKVTADVVRDMLGLADRSRIFDLLETLLKGETGPALEAFAGLGRDGADPVQVLADLAEAAHVVTRAKIAGADGGGDTLSKEEQTRAGALADKLTVPLLSRAWQMLVKGYEEAGRAPDAFAAAEMVLIRMAYTAELPTPDDLLRRGGSGEASTNGAGSGAVNRETPPPAHPQASAAPEPQLRSFADVVAYVGQKRDVSLKIELEEQVRLVRFQPGMIELRLEEGARSGIAGDLKRKLDTWTSETWTVAISNDEGGKTIREEKLERDAAEIELVRDAPLLKAALEAFPGAEITDVKPLSAMDDDGTNRDEDAVVVNKKGPGR
ncbi:MAG: DNA polymerase III subunit gamma/tau [Hyphomicrobiaceae bacterium]